MGHISVENIEKAGWVRYKETKKEWIGWEERVVGRVKYRHGFVKGNFLLVYDERYPHIEILAKDFIQIDFLPEFPERFGITIPCDNMELFNAITKAIKA